MPYKYLKIHFKSLPDSFIEPNEYENYLGIAVGSTLSLVMDTTGSMASEIAAAQDRFVEIIETTKGTVNQPLLYVLSPFNDPSKNDIN